MAKFLEILLRDSILALFYIANILFYLGGLYDSRIPLVNFLLDTRYIHSKLLSRSILSLQLGGASAVGAILTTQKQTNSQATFPLLRLCKSLLNLQKRKKNLKNRERKRKVPLGFHKNWHLNPKKKMSAHVPCHCLGSMNLRRPPIWDVKHMTAKNEIWTQLKTGSWVVSCSVRHTDVTKGLSTVYTVILFPHFLWTFFVLIVKLASENPFVNRLYLRCKWWIDLELFSLR